MAVTQIKIKNFKSFDEEEINLGRFNVLIGENASGKSNFVKIFEFLRDISESGLNNAVSMQGGVEYLRNINIGASEDFSITIVFDTNFKLKRGAGKDIISISVYEGIYEFSLNFIKESEFKVARDRLTLKCEFAKAGKKTGRKPGAGEIIFSRTNGKINVELNKPEDVHIKKEDIFIFPPFFEEIKIPSKAILLETQFAFLTPLESVFKDILIYDFDPKLPKNATPITGKAELEEDGSNLSIVLRNIIDDKDKKRMLFNLVKDILPFIEDIDVEKSGDKSLLFNLKEVYSKKQSFPASLISDGTINITALIIALYFEKKQVTIIEEPERNLHPYLISKIVEMMRDASKNKQIIVTTHNSEVVKHAGLKNILLVSRNEKGFSRISRPIDKEEVKIFMENKIGIDELYVQKLLEEYG